MSIAPVARRGQGVETAGTAGWHRAFARIKADLVRIRLNYAAGSPAFKMRIWIVSAFSVDVAATLLFFIIGGSSRALSVEAWYQQGFPSNLIVVRNVGARELKHIDMLLDSHYRAQIEAIGPGAASGLEIDRAFVDEEQLGPPASYTPKRLRIHSGAHAVEIQLGRKE